MKISLPILILASCLLIASCNSNEATASTAESNDINSSITVTAPPSVNTYKLNDFVRVFVQNNSDHEVLISLENAIDIRLESGNEWLNVSNSQKSFREILLSPKDQKETSLTLFSVIPEIKAEKAVTVRITIAGLDQSTKQEVSGYVDIILNP